MPDEAQPASAAHPRSTAHPEQERPAGHAHGHAHSHGHGQGHDHGGAPDAPDEAALAELLDLDATLLGGYLSQAADVVAEHVEGAPRLIVDLGAGTGVGAIALARRFPGAAVVAVDRSRAMLDRVEDAARAGGLSDRVSAKEADLDAGWPPIEGPDLVWASSSLHEVADPGRLMRHVLGALVPGGLFVVVEMDSLARFLPVGAQGVESRMHDVLDRVGWNHHPDWEPHLQRSGFQVVGRRTLTTEAGAGIPEAGDYADRYLRRMRSAVDAELPTADLAVLDGLLDRDSPHAVLTRADLTVRSSRTLWVARRP